MTRQPAPHVTVSADGTRWLHPAPWGRRVVASLVDLAIGVTPAFAHLVGWRIAHAAEGPQARWDGTDERLLGLALAWALLAWIVNRGVLQSRTGRSVGKALVRIRLVQAPAMRPPSFGTALWRDFGAGAGRRGAGELEAMGDPLGQTNADRATQTFVVSG